MHILYRASPLYHWDHGFLKEFSQSNLITPLPIWESTRSPTIVVSFLSLVCIMYSITSLFSKSSHGHDGHYTKPYHNSSNLFPYQKVHTFKAMFKALGTLSLPSTFGMYPSTLLHLPNSSVRDPQLGRMLRNRYVSWDKSLIYDLFAGSKYVYTPIPLSTLICSKPLLLKLITKLGIIS